MASKKKPLAFSLPENHLRWPLTPSFGLEEFPSRPGERPSKRFSASFLSALRTGGCNDLLEGHEQNLARKAKGASSTN